MGYLDKNTLKAAEKLAFQEKEADVIFNFNPLEFTILKVIEINDSFTEEEMQHIAYVNTRTLSLRQALILEIEDRLLWKVKIEEMDFEELCNKCNVIYKGFIKNRDKKKLKYSLEYCHPRFNIRGKYSAAAFLRFYEPSLLKIILMRNFYKLENEVLFELVLIIKKVQDYRI